MNRARADGDRKVSAGRDPERHGWSLTPHPALSPLRGEGEGSARSVSLERCGEELRQAFSEVDGGAHVSTFVDMHDIGDMLVHAGFQHPVMEMEMLTLTYADLKPLLRDLKGIGAHNAASDRARGMMGKSAWQKLEQAYESFRKEGRLPATYEVIYGHAWAGDKTRLEDGRQIIQFNIQQRKAGLR